MRNLCVRRGGPVPVPAASAAEDGASDARAPASRLSCCTRVSGLCKDAFAAAFKRLHSRAARRASLMATATPKLRSQTRSRVLVRAPGSPGEDIAESLCCSGGYADRSVMMRWSMCGGGDRMGGTRMTRMCSSEIGKLTASNPLGQVSRRLHGPPPVQLSRHPPVPGPPGPRTRFAYSCPLTHPARHLLSRLTSRPIWVCARTRRCSQRVLSDTCQQPATS